jgi:hypothetical protein
MRSRRRPATADAADAARGERPRKDAALEPPLERGLPRAGRARDKPADGARDRVEGAVPAPLVRPETRTRRSRLLSPAVPRGIPEHRASPGHEPSLHRAPPSAHNALYPCQPFLSSSRSRVRRAVSVACETRGTRSSRIFAQRASSSIHAGDRGARRFAWLQRAGAQEADARAPAHSVDDPLLAIHGVPPIRVATHLGSPSILRHSSRSSAGACDLRA